MLAKLMAGGGDYDIAVASDFMVEVLIAQNLLARKRVVTIISENADFKFTGK